MYTRVFDGKVSRYTCHSGAINPEGQRHNIPNLSRLKLQGYLVNWPRSADKITEINLDDNNKLAAKKSYIILYYTMTYKVSYITCYENRRDS